MGRGGAVAAACALVLAWSLAANADPVAHQVDGAASDEHVLVILDRSALCDPADGNPGDPKDPHFVCRYAIRGTYADQSMDAYLGAGSMTGRFLIDTRSFDGSVPGYGCFGITGGVVKFSPESGGRIRFKLSRAVGRICQDFDGIDVNAGDRSITWLLKATPGACTPPYCGAAGKLRWSSNASPDPEAPPGVVEYADTASFHGVVTSP